MAMAVRYYFKKIIKQRGALATRTPSVPLPPLPPRIYPPVARVYGGMMIHAKFFWEIFGKKKEVPPLLKKFFSEFFGQII